MRGFRERGAGHVFTARKSSLNSIILPPIEPPNTPRPALVDGNLLELLVTKSKPNATEVVAIGRNTDIRSPEAGGNVSAKVPNGNSGVSPLSSPVPGNGNGSGSGAGVAQLEQNIKYLQEQHQLMLTGLHHEIDCLRHRNRELQFQLVFAKGTNASTPSSPEDDKQKLYSSPKVLNITPLQVEILEKELGEMKIQLQESECRNVYLSAIVDEQKKKLERYERDRERERERGIQPDPELLRKLDDAESLIRRLRRENSDLRRDNAAAAAAAAVAPVAYPQREYHHQSRNSGQRRRGGNGGNNSGNGGNGANSGNGGGNGGNGGNLSGNTSGSNHPNVTNASNASSNAGNNSGQPYRPNWFPPLHTQNYWQQQNRPQASHVDTLPQLQSSGHHVVYSQQQGQMHPGHGRRASGNSAGGGNNNHYQPQNGERKYRGNNQNRVQKSS